MTEFMAYTVVTCLVVGLIFRFIAWAKDGFGLAELASSIFGDYMVFVLKVFGAALLIIIIFSSLG